MENAVDLKKYYTTKRMILMNLISAGGAIIFIIISSSLMKFYTDIIGLSPAAYGVVFLLFSIWNGVNDILIAYWADRHPYHPKKGKYRRYIKWSIPIIVIPLIALLNASPSWNEMFISIYLLVMLLIYEAAKTLLDVSFGAFTINTFLSSEKRSKVGAIANYMNMLPVFMGGMIPVWLMTGEFTRMTIVAIFTGCIVFGGVLILLGARFIKEDPEFYKNIEVAENIKDVLKLFFSLVKDKVVVLYIIAFFLIQVATGNYFTGYIYYMDNVLEVGPLKATLPDVIAGMTQMLIFPFIVIVVKKLGVKRTYIAGMMLAVLGHTLLTLPAGYYFISMAYIIILAGYAFPSVLTRTWNGLLVDHVELTTGKRQPALIAGIMAILLVPAASFQPLILSWLLQITNYDGNVKHQTAEVVNAIRLGTGIIPAVILLVGLIVLMFIPFSFAREKEIQNLISVKHNIDHVNEDDLIC